MSRLGMFRVLALVTVIGMPLLAWVISWLFHLDFSLSQWFFSENLIKQIVIGVVYGVLVGAIASWISNQNFMKSTRQRYSRALHGVKFSWADVLFISLCAGIGEEILFRFALQSLIGIWLAALIFVAIHGYLSYKNWPLTVYGLFMVLASAGFGYMAEELGLLSAMVAHTAVDVYLLSEVKIEELREEKHLKTEDLENDFN